MLVLTRTLSYCFNSDLIRSEKRKLKNDNDNNEIMDDLQNTQAHTTNKRSPSSIIDIEDGEIIGEEQGLSSPPTKKVKRVGIPVSQLIAAQEKAGNVRVCSICNVSKAKMDFSKTQLSKGTNAKCSACINKPQQQKPKRKKQKKAESESVALENSNGGEAGNQKPPPSTSMLVCGVCKKEKHKKQQFAETSQLNKLKKDAETYGINNSSLKDVLDICKMCMIAQEEKITNEKFLKYEELLHNKTKKLHDEGIKELEEKHVVADFETEMMKKRTDVLYMVTSVSTSGGDPIVAPVLHGIYTTCHQAQTAARKAFEKISATYRDGQFVEQQTAAGPISKCDLSEFLVPAAANNKIPRSVRLMYEIMTNDGEYDDRSVVHVSTVHVKTNDSNNSSSEKEDTLTRNLRLFPPYVPSGGGSSEGLLEEFEYDATSEYISDLLNPKKCIEEGDNSNSNNEKDQQQTTSKSSSSKSKSSKSRKKKEVVYGIFSQYVGNRVRILLSQMFCFVDSFF